jgi:LuxR family maltose regulon positive regulatory protein
MTIAMNLSKGDPPRQAAILDRRLHPPRGLAGSITRPGLTDRLEQGLAGQIVLLKAPPGFGKTALMSTAFFRLRASGEAAAWLTVMPADDDPQVFLHDLIVAMRRAGVSARHPDPPRLDEVLDALDRQERPVTLFIDAIGGISGHGPAPVLDALLRNLPPQLRLVLGVTTRCDMPLSQFRLRGLLTEIGPAQLAFTPAEVRRLAAHHLPRKDVESVVAGTQGWPAASHLALSCLGAELRGEEKEAVLASSHSVFREFIRDEVLPGLTQGTRRVLQLCCLLDAFTLDLAARVTGVLPFELDIETLHPIIQPAPRGAGWMRVHPVVKAALAAMSPPTSEAAAAFYRTTAAWFAERGDLEQAVSHAARAGDFAMAAKTIRHAGGVKIFLRSGYAVLSAILANLPDAVVDASPNLQLCRALVLAKQGRIHRARHLVAALRQLARTGEADQQAEPLAEADLQQMEALIDVYEDVNLDPAHVAALERQAAETAPGETWQRGWIYNHLCIAYGRSGDLDRARGACVKAMACYREERTAYGQIFMLTQDGLLSVTAGNPGQAITALKQAEDLVRLTHWGDGNLAAIVRVPMAEALYLRGEVAEADRILAEALPVMAAGEGWVDLFLRGYGTKARAAAVLRGVDAALAVLDTAAAVALERDLPRLSTAVGLLRVEILAEGGQLEPASDLLDRLRGRGLADRMSAEPGMGWPTWHERYHALLNEARLLLRAGDAKSALSVLTSVTALARQTGAMLFVLEAALLRTEAAWTIGEPNDALAALQVGLALASAQEVLQPFLCAGSSLAGVIRALIRRFGLTVFSPVAVRFLARVTGASFRLAAGADSAGGHLLSPRERDVLELLIGGSSNKEMARVLDVSGATVKFHLRNIYAKIGVSRRGMAVACANEMGLTARSQGIVTLIESDRV